MRTQTEFTISVLADIPEDLHDQFKAFLDQQPDWDADRVFTVAIAQFLMQQSFGPEIDAGVAARRYMQGMFDRRKA